MHLSSERIRTLDLKLSTSSAVLRGADSVAELLRRCCRLLASTLKLDFRQKKTLYRNFSTKKNEEKNLKLAQENFFRPQLSDEKL